MGNIVFKEQTAVTVPTPATGKVSIFVDETATPKFKTEDGVTHDFSVVNTEQVQDIVGAFMTSTASITFTYDDAGNTLSAAVPVGAITDTLASLATKPAVTVVATSNQALTGLPTIDSQATAAGSIILNTAQTAGAENGPWVAAAGAWSRPTWYPNGGTTQAFQFITTLVRLGATYQGSVWRMTTSGAITIGTTVTTWVVTPHALNASTVTGILPNANTTAASANTSSAIVTRDSSGNFIAGTITANLTGNVSGSAASFTGSLVGDVTGTQGATVVSTVGGSSSANVHTAELAANAAVSINTASTIVKRDVSGNFVAGTITANLTGNVTGTASGDQPLDATLTALAAANWVANALPIGTGADTLSQTTFAANTFPGRSSSGNLIAKTITDAGFTWLSAVSAVEETALLNNATTALAGLMSPTDKSKSNNWFNKNVYNVLDNGISPANSGATNVTAWNALMTTIAGAGATATVAFPPSSSFYDFASVCAIPSGVHLRIVGYGPTTRTSEAFGTIIRTTSATADIFSCGDWYQEFVNLHFRTSVTRSAGAAINSGNNIAINVYDCNFDSQFNCIVYTGGSSAGNLAIVRNCSFTSTVNFSIQIDGANANTIIVECVADGTPAAVAHVEVNQCGSLLLANCDFIRATNNMRLNPDSGTKGVFSVYCVNIFFDTAAGSSVKFLGGATGTNIQRVKFVNCWFSGSVTGCEFAAVTSTNKPTGIDFVNCDIFSNSAFGILDTEVQDFSLSNCRIAGNTTAGIRTNAATGSVTKFNIQNCVVGPASGIGANGIGIDIVAGTYGAYQVSGNIVMGNTSNNNIIDAGSVATTDLKLIGDNLGHLLKGMIASQGVTPVSVPITTETLVLSARIPANAVVAGQVFRIKGIGVMSAANAVTWRLRVGTAGTAADTPLVWVPIATPVGAANCRHGCEVYLTVRSNGAGGTVQAEGAQYSSTAAAMTWVSTTAGVAATGAIATNAVWFIDLTLSQTIGSSLIQQAVIEAL